jgi:glycosyltransferase involved in cell wall biosynthesis
MNAAPLKLVHVAAWIRTIGGVETLLARHARFDADQGFAATQLSLFDRPRRTEGTVYATQAFSWRSTPRAMRRAMAAAFASHPGSVIAWHNGWGLPWFADIDGSERRIVCLEDSEADFGRWLAKVAGWIDGVTCISSPAAEAVTRLLPGLPPERLTILPLPIAPPVLPNDPRTPGQEWVIGCAGRLVRAQKRWDRLVPFVAELHRLAVPFRLEIVSHGPLRGWLERRLGSNPAVRFLGWQQPVDYWRRLQDWDAAVFFSDHEGGPIVLLETMAAGVVPFYPTIGGSLGDEYVPRLDPRCYYPAGDPAAAARAVREVLASPPESLVQLRTRARALVEPNRSGRYDSAFGEFVRRIADLPRISRGPGAARPGRLTDRLPLGLITRVFPAALWR